MVIAILYHGHFLWKFQYCIEKKFVSEAHFFSEAWHCRTTSAGLIGLQCACAHQGHVTTLCTTRHVLNQHQGATALSTRHVLTDSVPSLTSAERVQQCREAGGACAVKQMAHVPLRLWHMFRYAFGTCAVKVFKPRVVTVCLLRNHGYCVVLNQCSSFIVNCLRGSRH